ncbi:MAG: hypothetical protein EOP83_20635 [Verrucomicrobiaceae bacterium]|nr:MAG: hypothetical protein EOP83_20635 [Verrucomicrobiaceae bacterium]
MSIAAAITLDAPKSAVNTMGTGGIPNGNPPARHANALGQILYVAMAPISTLQAAKGVVTVGRAVAGGAAAVMAKRAAGVAPKLLGQPIIAAEKDLARVINKHGPSTSGKGGLLKSRFNAGEDIEALINGGTHQQARAQVGSRNLVHTFDVGRNIGTDVTTGFGTSIMTIVTQPSGRLVTAFPWRPYMGLDFAQVDESGQVSGATVRIGADIHNSLIQAASASRFPLVYRMHDYYSDVTYRREELPALARELEEYGPSVSEPSHLQTIGSMRTLVLDCIEKGLSIEAIAD